jgi:hypothetical protein
VFFAIASLFLAIASNIVLFYFSKAAFRDAKVAFQRHETPL